MDIQTSTIFNITTKTIRLSRYLLVFLSLSVLFAGPLKAQTPEEDLISFEGEIETTIEADYTEGTTDSEANFTAGLAMENNLTLDLDLTNEYESNGDSTWEAELDFEV